MSIENGIFVQQFEVLPGEFMSLETGDHGEVIAICVNEDNDTGGVRLGMSPHAAVHLAHALLTAVLYADVPPEDETHSDN